VGVTYVCSPTATAAGVDTASDSAQLADDERAGGEVRRVADAGRIQLRLETRRRGPMHLPVLHPVVLIRELSSSRLLRPTTGPLAN